MFQLREGVVKWRAKPLSRAAGLGDPVANDSDLPSPRDPDAGPISGKEQLHSADASTSKARNNLGYL
jgi:hypothetical protein